MSSPVVSLAVSLLLELLVVTAGAEGEEGEEEGEEGRGAGALASTVVGVTTESPFLGSFELIFAFALSRSWSRSPRWCRAHNPRPGAPSRNSLGR